MQFLNFVILNNPLRTWLAALLIAAAIYFLLKQIRRVLVKRLEKVVNGEPLSLSALAGRMALKMRGIFALAVGLYAGSLMLELSNGLHLFLRTLALFVILIQVGWWAVELVEYSIARRVQQNQDEASRKTTLNALGLLAKLVVWSLVLLLALDNIPGVEITSLIAGLGITGIAVGLAVQNILGDLFGSLTIALDQPFVIGDSISVGEFTGTVEHIGLKSTRVRSLSGEELVFANSDLLNSRIRNFKRMEQRRIVQQYTLVYQTPYEKLVRIPDIMREIITAQLDTTFDRAHFSSISPTGLMIEVVYFLDSADYRLYMDTQQKINLEVLRRFNEEGLEFAYPTQKVYVEGER